MARKDQEPSKRKPRTAEATSAGKVSRIAGHKAFEPNTYAPPPGPGRIVSEAERHGVPPTDTRATSPLGVGQSINRRAEDLAKKGEKRRTGAKGKSGRPHGETKGTVPGSGTTQVENEQIDRDH
jgi:hypothetical protein